MLFLGNDWAEARHDIELVDESGRRLLEVVDGLSTLHSLIADHLDEDDEADQVDLGPDFCAARTNPERKVRQHVRELQALGYSVTLNPAA